MIDERMRAWLLDGPLRGSGIDGVSRLAGGFGNDNVALRTATGERYVLRRYLRDNTCAVEAALAERVAGVVPVPEVVAADPDGTVAGEPVLLSRFVPGTLVSELLVGLPAPGAESLGRAVGEVFARAGTVGFERPGFFSGADLVPGPPGIEPAAGLAAFVDGCLGKGDAAGALTPAEADGLRALAARWEPLLTAVHGSRQLVHSDANPKNLLARPDGDGWTVTAVLDWEFAFSGPALVDVGNMLRFPADTGMPFADGFVAGYAAHGELPDGWRELSRALDLYALADLLTRPPDHPFRAKAADAIRAHLAR